MREVVYFLAGCYALPHPEDGPPRQGKPDQRREGTGRLRSPAAMAPWRVPPPHPRAPLVGVEARGASSDIATVGLAVKKPSEGFLKSLFTVSAPVSSCWFSCEKRVRGSLATQAGHSRPHPSPTTGFLLPPSSADGCSPLPGRGAGPGSGLAEARSCRACILVHAERCAAGARPLQERWLQPGQAIRSAPVLLALALPAYAQPRALPVEGVKML